MSANHILLNFLSAENFPEWKRASQCEKINDAEMKLLIWDIFIYDYSFFGGPKDSINIFFASSNPRIA